MDRRPGEQERALNLSYHYTHWNVRDDLKRIASHVSAAVGCSWNTYRDHPPGYGLDARSVDFWGLAGRGFPIIPTKGNRVVDFWMVSPRREKIAWLIWQGRIWTPSDGWRPYNNWHGGHWDHVHVTVKPL